MTHPTQTNAQRLADELEVIRGKARDEILLKSDCEIISDTEDELRRLSAIEADLLRERIAHGLTKGILTCGRHQLLNVTAKMDEDNDQLRAELARLQAQLATFEHATQPATNHQQVQCKCGMQLTFMVNDAHPAAPAKVLKRLSREQINSMLLDTAQDSDEMHDFAQEVQQLIATHNGLALGTDGDGGAV